MENKIEEKRINWKKTSRSFSFNESIIQKVVRNQPLIYIALMGSHQFCIWRAKQPFTLGTFCNWVLCVGFQAKCCVLSKIKKGEKASLLTPFMINTENRQCPLSKQPDKHTKKSKKILKIAKKIYDRNLVTYLFLALFYLLFSHWNFEIFKDDDIWLKITFSL